ncbi:hypothetical protein [Vagococcus zengguangii]|uniref:hypothetical protein n=1 Tax=Vagococcus zengguangii TaxID=2571750 RepID=UPI0012AEE6B1|nr:hypothetical protein [Vagococcus zengguangii]
MNNKALILGVLFVIGLLLIPIASVIEGFSISRKEGFWQIGILCLMALAIYFRNKLRK